MHKEEKNDYKRNKHYKILCNKKIFSYYKKNMNILLFGGTGMLGKYIYNILSEYYKNISQ